MRPYAKSILELFDGKKRYLIPLYQRQYAWKISPQLELLWEDIERAAAKLTSDRTAASPHFMGALVIAEIKTFDKQVRAYEVIDGQQRLTTFQLLLTALRDIAEVNESRYAAEINAYLLNDGVMETPDVERFKLWPTVTDRRALISLIDPLADPTKIAPPPKDEDGAVRPAVAAHSWFRSQIENHVGKGKDFDEFKLEKLFEALKTGLAAVSIELEGGDDPQTIFETLNSRGVDLTAGDLMRNFIFQRAKGLGQNNGSLTVDELYERFWLPLDSWFWRENDSRGRQTRSRLDWMLVDHLAMKKADLVSVESLFESYRRWVLNDQPYDSVADELEAITKSADVYRRVANGDINDELGRFGLFSKAFDVSTTMPLVLYLATEGNLGPQLGDALKMIESFILRRDICGLQTGNYNRQFVQIIERIRLSDASPLEELSKQLSASQSDVTRWPHDEEWKSGWLGRDQYKTSRQPRLRYIFEGIERAKRSRLSEEVDIKSALTVEHILPQKWRSHWPVPGFDHLQDGEFDIEKMTREAHREQHVNKLGNLTLLTHSLNAAISNGPFSQKMPAVKAHASLALNRELQSFDEWDEDTIARRGAALFEVAREVWKGPPTPVTVSQ
ncbi:DUF262 domain-containing HNH endonuclease family protein [uncultured Brevundimonas sp.]|uniref:DUF262 domain-containing protein n=1 Tax=uncultured Brevundimonas sp. TaxID=213418 RepID=UPI0025DF9D57|nr:DUF262 domain-containing HNH endonuclease family protein [uncultured Brevundimonas sp.]